MTIITDSAASIPHELTAAHDIHVVPMRITIDEQTYEDGVVPQQDLLDRIRAGARVATAAPSPGAYTARIDEVAGEDGALVLCIASTMSATHDAAVVGARAAGAHAEVLDTGTAAGGQGLVVVQAAQRAAAGEPVDVIREHARRVADEVKLIGAVANLEFLVHSGRVPGIAGRAGDAVGTRPLFEFRDGKAHPLRPSFRRSSSLDRVVARWRHSRPDDAARLHVSALHALAEDDANALLDRVRAEVEPATAFVAEFSTVMVAHVGPGLTGLAWWWERGG